MGNCTNNASNNSNPDNDALVTTGGKTDNKDPATAITTVDSASVDEKKDDSGVGGLGRVKSLSQTAQEIVVRIVQGKNLPETDLFGGSDPFIKVTMDNKVYTTKVVRKSTSPVCNEDIVVSGMDLFRKVHDIKFDVFDWDWPTKNDYIGGFNIHFDDDLVESETPPFWYDVRNKKNEKAGEVQVQIQCRRNANELELRNYTHVLQFTINRGHELNGMEWLGRKSDPYCKVEWGLQAFRTQAVTNSTNPVWNETLFLFIDEHTQKDYFLTLSVLDSDLHESDHIGTGYIKASDFFEKKNNDLHDAMIYLQDKVITTDNSIRDTPVSPVVPMGSSSNVAGCGQISISSKLIPRRKIEREFFEHLLEHFDCDNNKKLDKREVRRILLYLNIPDDVDSFMQRYDADANEELGKDEILKMLEDYRFQDSEDSSKFILHHLQHTQDFNPFTAKLMQGFFRSGMPDSKARNTIYIKDRKTGQLTQEHVPGYIQFALDVVYGTHTGKLIAKTTYAQDILHKMSKDKGIEYDDPKSTAEIHPFIETHNLRIDILAERNLNNYRTFNDFFARALNHEKYRPMNDAEQNVVSPADCRMMVFKSVLDSTKFWIKGDQFTVERLLGTRKSIANSFDGGSFCIARLAPQDYHRWHWPVSGKVTKITHIDGALFTVNPIAINKNVNVYTENKRAVIELDTVHLGKMLMFVIGATMVGSYNLFQKGYTPLIEGMDVEKGEVSGEFRFGGSTILLLFEPGKIEWKTDLLNTSKSKIETLIEVRDDIGGTVGLTNPTDLFQKKTSAE